MDSLSSGVALWGQVASLHISVAENFRDMGVSITSNRVEWSCHCEDWEQVHSEGSFLREQTGKKVAMHNWRESVRSQRSQTTRILYGREGVIEAFVSGQAMPLWRRHCSNTV
jgi:hypothetical protein